MDRDSVAEVLAYQFELNRPSLFTLTDRERQKQEDAVTHEQKILRILLNPSYKAVLAVILKYGRCIRIEELKKEFLAMDLIYAKRFVEMALSQLSKTGMVEFIREDQRYRHKNTDLCCVSRPADKLLEGLTELSS